VENLFKDQFIKALNKRRDLLDLEPVRGKIGSFKFHFVSDDPFEILDEQYTIDKDSSVIHPVRSD
jgi:hypothetical protein